MLKRTMVFILCSSMMLIDAGVALSCMKATAEEEVSNGNVKLLAEYIEAKALPKLLKNNDVQKFEDRTKIRATQNADGSYRFSVLGITVAHLNPEDDFRVVAATLAAHLIEGPAKTAATQASSSAPTHS